MTDLQTLHSKQSSVKKGILLKHVKRLTRKDHTERCYIIIIIIYTNYVQNQNLHSSILIAYNKGKIILCKVALILCPDWIRF